MFSEKMCIYIHFFFKLRISILLANYNAILFKITKTTQFITSTNLNRVELPHNSIYFHSYLKRYNYFSSKTRHSKNQSQKNVYYCFKFLKKN